MILQRDIDLNCSNTSYFHISVLSENSVKYSGLPQTLGQLVILWEGIVLTCLDTILSQSRLNQWNKEKSKSGSSKGNLFLFCWRQAQLRLAALLNFWRSWLFNVFGFTELYLCSLSSFLDWFHHKHALKLAWNLKVIESFTNITFVFLGSKSRDNTAAAAALPLLG